MPNLIFVRDRRNVIDRPVELPVEQIDWEVSEVRFSIQPRGGSLAEAIVVKSTNEPPGGIDILARTVARITLEPDDLQRVPAASETFEWSLHLDLGSRDVYVLDSGGIETRTLGM